MNEKIKEIDSFINWTIIIIINFLSRTFIFHREKQFWERQVVAYEINDWIYHCQLTLILH